MNFIEKQRIKIEKIENSKQKLKEKEKALQEQKKIQSRKTLHSLGKLIFEAGIANLDEKALVGALLEISEKSKDESNIKNWQKYYEESKTAKNKYKNAFAISFKSPPDTETKEKLKEIDFKWNKFRMEFYGFAEEENLKKLFINQECQIEKIS